MRGRWARQHVAADKGSTEETAAPRLFTYGLGGPSSLLVAQAQRVGHAAILLVTRVFSFRMGSFSAIGNARGEGGGGRAL